VQPLFLEYAEGKATATAAFVPGLDMWGDLPKGTSQPALPAPAKRLLAAGERAAISIVLQLPPQPVHTLFQVSMMRPLQFYTARLLCPPTGQSWIPDDVSVSFMID